MAVFKSIKNPNCASLPYLYAAVKSANDLSTLDSSNVVDFDGLMGIYSKI